MVCATLTVFTSYFMLRVVFVHVSVCVCAYFAFRRFLFSLSLTQAFWLLLLLVLPGDMRSSHFDRSNIRPLLNEFKTISLNLSSCPARHVGLTMQLLGTQTGRANIMQSVHLDTGDRFSANFSCTRFSACTHTCIHARQQIIRKQKCP